MCDFFASRRFWRKGPGSCHPSCDCVHLSTGAPFTLFQRGHLQQGRALVPSELLLLSADICVFPAPAQPLLQTDQICLMSPQTPAKPQNPRKERPNIPWCDPKVLLMWSNTDSKHFMFMPKSDSQTKLSGQSWAVSKNTSL